MHMVSKKDLNTADRKTVIARSVRGPKLQEPRAEDALAEPYLVQKTLVIWLQQITKFSVKDVNLETIIDMQSWCKTWPPNGSSRIRAKQKLLRKPKGAFKSSWSRIESLKSFTLTIPWNLAKACEDLSWNHCTSTPHRSETSGIAERAVRRIKEGTCSIVAIRSGWEMVGGFRGMLLLYAKHSRSHVWMGRPLWGAVRNTI